MLKTHTEIQISLTGLQAGKSTHAAVQPILWFLGHGEAWAGCYSLPSQKVTPCPTGHTRSHLCRAIAALSVACLVFPSHFWGSFPAQGTPASQKYTCPYAFLLISTVPMIISVSGTCSISSYWSSLLHHADVCDASWATQARLCPHCHQQTRTGAEQGNFRHSTAAGRYVPYGFFFFIPPSKSQQKQVVTESF